MGLDKLRYPSRPTEAFDELPIGFYLPWEKAMQGSLPEWFVECNGQLLDDPESSFHGNYIPNLNGVAIVKNVNFTSGSATASMVTTKDIYAGASITSASVPAGAIVLSIDSETNITLSNAATATGIVESTIGGNGGVFLRGGATSGVWQSDQMQQITGTMVFQIYSASGAFTKGASTPGDKSAPAGEADNFIYFDSANSTAQGGARTGAETRPTNHSVIYVMKIKLLGKTKLITGYNINGDAFHQFQLGNPKENDILVFYDITTSTYKKCTRQDLVYPVGAVYTQYATSASNDLAVALPVTESPASLYGGTWEKLWDDEGIDFHTERTSDVGLQTRTNGLQADQMQGFYIGKNDTWTLGSFATEGIPPAAGDASENTQRTGYRSTPINPGRPVTDGTNGTPRTGTVTCDSNRLVRIWKRIS